VAFGSLGWSWGGLGAVLAVKNASLEWSLGSLGSSWGGLGVAFGSLGAVLGRLGRSRGGLRWLGTIGAKNDEKMNATEGEESCYAKIPRREYDFRKNHW
jgi:hypothetical protein